MRFQAYSLVCIFILICCIQCRACYIPVALLLEQQQEHTLLDDSFPVDPILAELAVHIDQCYAPLIVSRQLVHGLIRQQQEFIKAKDNPGTRLGTLYDYLNSYAQTAHTKSTLTFEHCYQNRTKKPNEAKSTTTSAQRNQQAIYFQRIHTFLTLNPHLVAYLFITRIPLHAWHIYQVEESGNSIPLYLLLPPSTNTSTFAASRNTHALQFHKLDTERLKQQALGQSQQAQREDYKPITAHSITTTLKALRKNLSEDTKKSKLILSLSGHGRYSRSQYGIISDHIKPTDPSQLIGTHQLALPTQDAYSVIGGLNVPEFKKLLRIVHKQIPTALLYYDSCFSGNHHLIGPYTKEDGIPLELDYTVATRCIDGGMSYHDHFKIEITPSHAQLYIRCPMDPKRFFEHCKAWHREPEQHEKASLLKAAFLSMIGNKNKNNVMLREPVAQHFAPLVTKRAINITPEITAGDQQAITIRKRYTHLLLGHNKIDIPIHGSLPIIRSTIQTNSTHYIKKIECSGSPNSNMIDMLSRMFFHQHNHESVSRMVFLIKTAKFIAQDKTHTMHDLLVLHHTPWADRKNSFAIWRNNTLNNAQTPTYCLAVPNSVGQLHAQGIQEIPPYTAHSSILYYVGLGATDQSYIDAPPLKAALPQAFDDSRIKELCTTALRNDTCNQKVVAQMWQELGYN